MAKNKEKDEAVEVLNYSVYPSTQYVEYKRLCLASEIPIIKKEIVDKVNEENKGTDKLIITYKDVSLVFKTELTLEEQAHVIKKDADIERKEALLKTKYDAKTNNNL